MKTRESRVLEAFAPYDTAMVDRLLTEAAEQSICKIVVLDDDPTGVQTIHDISVYTDWSLESIRQGFAEEQKLFFILTNSRGFTVEQTTKAHREIGQNLNAVSHQLDIPYLVISRGDSTLRGHYPLETELLKEAQERAYPWRVDGEILCPFFAEGGRFTIDNIHYVKYQDILIPAGETEFAEDKTFGYRSSDLCSYVEEKTNGRFPAESVHSISLDELRAFDIDGIYQKLMQVENFNKIVVNAVNEYDVKVFCIALYRALQSKKHFLFRTAAAFVKAFGNITTKPLLTREEMVARKSNAGGIIVVGSHTEKTTMQLEALKQLDQICFLEMNSDLVLEEGGLEREVARIVSVSEGCIQNGITVAISTKRQLLVVKDDSKEAALLRSVKISQAVQALVGNLTVTPAFVVAKGGITSSDVGTKALGVRRAVVLGQIRPGIPVWKLGVESKFPRIPYIIFPGNVGEAETLREAVEILMEQ